MKDFIMTAVFVVVIIALIGAFVLGDGDTTLQKNGTDIGNGMSNKLQQISTDINK